MHLERPRRYILIYAMNELHSICQHQVQVYHFSGGGKAIVKPSVGILSLNAYYSEVSGISVDASTSNDSCYKSIIASINCFSLNGHECFMFAHSSVPFPKAVSHR